jgi:hypothetical protein
VCSTRSPWPRRQLEGNQFTGTIPKSWNALGPRLSYASIYRNPQLGGCVPATWRLKLTDERGALDNARVATQVAGFC